MSEYRASSQSMVATQNAEKYKYNPISRILTKSLQLLLNLNSIMTPIIWSYCWSGEKLRAALQGQRVSTFFYTPYRVRVQLFSLFVKAFPSPITKHMSKESLGQKSFTKLGLHAHPHTPPPHPTTQTFRTLPRHLEGQFSVCNIVLTAILGKCKKI